MIAAHFKNGFNGDQLGDTFTKATDDDASLLPEPVSAAGVLRQLDRRHRGRHRGWLRGRQLRAGCPIRHVHGTCTAVPEYPQSLTERARKVPCPP